MCHLHSNSESVCADQPLIDRLLDAGLLIDTGVDGLYGRGAVFEDVIERFNDYITGFGVEDGAQRVHFPPGMSRKLFEKSGYMKGFPQLAGTIHAFMGGEADHGRLLETMEAGGDWTQGQKATDVVLTPAACYPLYPTAAKAGAVPVEGHLYDLSSYCFRHEPSRDPARMQLFRMREYVRMGTQEQVLAFRETWIQRGQDMMAGLGLPVTVDVANDPFFGRKGRILASGQRELTLKFELLVPVTSTENPTACLSFNYHQKHFGETWGLRTENGETAHTACVGFGMERVALALFAHHGLDVSQWPQKVRVALWS
jgi:seryl-tRNA synthetase